MQTEDNPEKGTIDEPVVYGPLEILYQDDYLVAIHKPAGLLVHRTAIAAGQTDQFAVQLVRDQVGRYVYPIHRIDRPTSGVLLFALDEETTRLVKTDFTEQRIYKRYLALVRGYTPESGRIDYPLAKWVDRKAKKKRRAKMEKGEVFERQAAVTDYTRLATADLAISVGPYETSRYSLVMAEPQSGRTHQIRRHLTHISHPIVGDRRYGDNQHNNMFREELGLPPLFLLAQQLRFTHPHTGSEIVINAQANGVWREACTRLGLLTALEKSEEHG